MISFKELNYIFLVLIVFSAILIIPTHSANVSTPAQDKSTVQILIVLKDFNFEKREVRALLLIDIRLKGIHNGTLRINIVNDEAAFLEIEPYNLQNETQYFASTFLRSNLVIEGSYYPFDSCKTHLRFELPLNVTLIDVEINYALAGDVLYTFEEGDKTFWIGEVSQGSSINVDLAINRKLVWAFPVLIPIFLGYLILGMSVKMKKNEKLSLHLTVYLSVLALSATLLLGIQNNIPARYTLSLTEVLILLLMACTSIFIACTLLNRELKIASIVSIFLIWSLFIWIISQHQISLNVWRAYVIILFVLSICLGFFILDGLRKSLINKPKKEK